MKPNFFIVGAPKCGTTALAKFLSEHSEVFMSTPKEPHFYNTDQNHHSFTEKSEYISLFDDAEIKHKRLGEASVWYLYSDVAVPNIEEEIDAPLYIVMFRNPVEMAPSLHEQMVFSGNENIKDFESAWRAQDVRRTGKSIPMFVNDRSYLYYKDACCLGRQLERMLARVPRSRILILFNEDLRDHPVQTWATVQDFLGVIREDRKEFGSVNVAKERKSMLLKKVNDIYANFRNATNMPSLRTGVFNQINSWNIRQRPRKPLSAEMKEELKAVFSDDVGLLERLTGRNLAHWKN